MNETNHSPNYRFTLAIQALVCECWSALSKSGNSIDRDAFDAACYYLRIASECFSRSRAGVDESAAAMYTALRYIVVHESGERLYEALSRVLGVRLPGDPVELPDENVYNEYADVPDSLLHFVEYGSRPTQTPGVQI